MRIKSERLFFSGWNGAVHDPQFQASNRRYLAARIAISIFVEHSLDSLRIIRGQEREAEKDASFGRVPFHGKRDARTTTTPAFSARLSAFITAWGVFPSPTPATTIPLGEGWRRNPR
jgi:hypothetical protein